METATISPAFVKGADEIYRCVALEEMGWVEHGFTTRHTVSSLPAVTTLRQIHSAMVLRAGELGKAFNEGDALISNEEGRRIGVRTADCVPILLADAEARSIAAIHAGWRGTAACIARRTVEQMRQEFGTRPEMVVAAIGPCIGVCCYQVGPEVKAQFDNLFPEWDGKGAKDGRVMLDLVEANRRMLILAGVEAGRIYSSDLCTSCCPRDFFSYRRDPRDPGRMVSFIGRRR